MKNTTKRLSLLLAAILLLGMVTPLTSQAVPVTGVYEYVVNTSWLNLRSGPGTNYDITGRAMLNEAVQILSYEGGSTWVSVRIVASGLIGFMDSTYLSSTPGGVPSPTAPPIPLITPAISGPINLRAVVRNPVPTQFLNLRQYASYAAPVLGIFYNGTQLTVMTETDGWYYVLMDNGLRGYFRKEFVSFDTEPGTPVIPGIIGTAKVVSPGGRVNMRQGPAYSYAVIASYYPGKTVSVYSKTGTFWRVAVDGIFGYIDHNFLSTTGGGSPVTPGGGNAVVRGSAKLNLRADPSLSARVIGQYSPGTAVKITRQGLDWCAVTIPATGAKGYFMTKYLTLSGLPEMPTKIVKNSGSYVNLRTKASVATGLVLTKVPHNSVVTMLSPGASWSRVRFGAINGYMMNAFLK
ncbi:MAG: SH3 domain-containing protein [Clostridiales bacterium]|nr:SH3 domain-containing protein [Clostridiales bacterium]